MLKSSFQSIKFKIFQKKRETKILHQSDAWLMYKIMFTSHLSSVSAISKQKIWSRENLSLNLPRSNKLCLSNYCDCDSLQFTIKPRNILLLQISFGSDFNCTYSNRGSTQWFPWTNKNHLVNKSAFYHLQNITRISKFISACQFAMLNFNSCKCNAKKVLWNTILSGSKSKNSNMA